MVSMQKVDSKFEISRLTKHMGQLVKSWSSKGGEPTLPDVAAAIETWAKDMVRMSYQDEVNSEGFAQAKSYINTAWENRDNRKSAIFYVSKAYAALRSIPEEVEYPEEATINERQSAKALFGDLVGHYKAGPQGYKELYNIRRHLAGFKATKSVNEVDFFNVGKIRGNLIEIAQRNASNPQISRMATKAANHLLTAERVAEKSPRHANAQFSEAIAALDRIGEIVSVKSAPPGYKPELTSTGRVAIKRYIDVAQKVSYNQPFSSPLELLPRAIKSIEAVVAMLSHYYDPKALSLANRSREHLYNAYRLAQNYPKVKSMGFRGWAYGGISEEFNAAMSKLGDLDSYISSAQ